MLFGDIYKNLSPFDRQRPELCLVWKARLSVVFPHHLPTSTFELHISVQQDGLVLEIPLCQVFGSGFTWSEPTFQSQRAKGWHRRTTGGLFWLILEKATALQTLKRKVWGLTAKVGRFGHHTNSWHLDKLLPTTALSQAPCSSRGLANVSRSWAPVLIY